MSQIVRNKYVHCEGHGYLNISTKYTTFSDTLSTNDNVLFLSISCTLYWICIELKWELF